MNNFLQVDGNTEMNNNNDKSSKDTLEKSANDEIIVEDINSNIKHIKPIVRKLSILQVENPSINGQNETVSAQISVHKDTVHKSQSMHKEHPVHININANKEHTIHRRGGSVEKIQVLR